MTVEELGKKAILILGFGKEGQATYDQKTLLTGYKVIPPSC